MVPLSDAHEAPPQIPAAEPSPAAPKLIRHKRSDIRAIKDQRDLLRKEPLCDSIPTEAHKDPFLVALEQLSLKEKKVQSITAAKQKLQELVDVRDRIPLKQKKELKQASRECTQQAKEVIKLCFRLLKEHGGKGSVVDVALQLLQDVLKADRYEELDEYLFTKIAKKELVETLLCSYLESFLSQTITQSRPETLFRTDLGWQQKLLRVMHNGYLSGLFKSLQDEVAAIRSYKLVEHAATGDCIHVRLAGKEALGCIAIAKKCLFKLPAKLLHLYGSVYSTIRTTFHDEQFADAQLAQFVFLRAINPQISKFHELDRYEKVDEGLLQEEKYKHEQCEVVAKIIQALVANLSSEKREKRDQRMDLFDPEYGGSLYDFIAVKEHIQVLADFVQALKTKMRP